MQLSKRFGDRSTISLLSQDESDGALSAPEMPTRRDRGITFNSFLPSVSSLRRITCLILFSVSTLT